MEAIVVTARPVNREPLVEPVAAFRRFCFDPLRLTRRGAGPAADDPHWQPLDEEVREGLGIVDPSTVLAMLVDHVRGHRMVLRIESKRTIGLEQSGCTLTVIGGTSHARLQDGMAAMFRSSGTNRHVNHPAGVPDLPGWRQHVWTRMPARGDTTLSPPADRRGAGESFLVVTDTALFYRGHDFVLGDFKTRTRGEPPVSILSMQRTSRPTAASRRRRGTS